ESSQYTLMSKTRTPSAAWSVLRDFHRKQGGQSRLLLTPKRQPHQPIACIYEACDLDWEVESILEHRMSPAGFEFKVKWLGVSQTDARWEPADNVEGSAGIVADYALDFPEIKPLLPWLPAQVEHQDPPDAQPNGFEVTSGNNPADSHWSWSNCGIPDLASESQGNEEI
ncbi:hypothetical protein BVRB_039330, partial [Beta vulgaris subsp. vulgaris]